MSLALTKGQAAIIASAIVPDIKAYIEAHRVEYEEFLKQEQKLDKSGGDISNG